VVASRTPAPLYTTPFPVGRGCVHVPITTSAWPVPHRRKVAEMAVVCFHPDNGQEAFVDRVPDMQHEATIMMEDRSCGADVGRGVVG
jgi:hypothetical protein